ncbi:MAG: tRNA (adenosine(37)-N6)-threonylcarbamoyltransferase complex dimerization subunit type 1 TsaB [Clostridia bacterium]|nr:tRNA (adenosine(37)-N6)-threonylcarbamoyltransferase complex dimerization subunit type 1 TsaB [Clostridia bacterium]
MKILSISTSSNIASVSISENDDCILELNINNNKTHSETLMPLIDELFKTTGLNLSDIDAVACDIGPGSFTGIRIGISSIKAIAETLNIPVIDVSSLEALAYNIQDENCKTICSLIDARNNQVYCGIFDKSHNLLENYLADDINIVKEALNKYEDILFVGDGAIIHKDLLEIEDFKSDNVIHSKNIAKCAYNKFKNNNTKTADTIMPLYLRKSQAERMKQKNG